LDVVEKEDKTTLQIIQDKYIAYAGLRRVGGVRGNAQGERSDIFVLFCFDVENSGRDRTMKRRRGGSEGGKEGIPASLFLLSSHPEIGLVLFCYLLL
jgi:hypothetical protein